MCHLDCGKNAVGLDRIGWWIVQSEAVEMQNEDKQESARMGLLVLYASELVQLPLEKELRLSRRCSTAKAPKRDGGCMFGISTLLAGCFPWAEEERPAGVPRLVLACESRTEGVD